MKARDINMLPPEEQEKILRRRAMNRERNAANRAWLKHMLDAVHNSKVPTQDWRGKTYAECGWVPSNGADA